jgi:hypothetical protein
VAAVDVGAGRDLGRRQPPIRERPVEVHDELAHRLRDGGGHRVLGGPCPNQTDNWASSDSSLDGPIRKLPERTTEGFHRMPAEAQRAQSQARRRVLGACRALGVRCSLSSKEIRVRFREARTASCSCERLAFALSRIRFSARRLLTFSTVFGFFLANPHHLLSAPHGERAPWVQNQPWIWTQEARGFGGATWEANRRRVPF